MKKKEDLRVIKTKSNLYKSLLQLMEEKTFEDIKVIDICNLSMINRSTFYDHFNDKYELLVSLLDDVKLELINNLKTDKNFSSLKEYYMEVIKLLIDYSINSNNKVFSALTILKKNNNSIAYDIMMEATFQAVIEHLNDNYINNSDIPTEIIAKFYVSGVLPVCIDMLQDNKYTEDDLFKCLDKLIPEVEHLIPKYK